MAYKNPNNLMIRTIHDKKLPLLYGNYSFKYAG